MNRNDKIHKIIAQKFIDMIENGMADGKWIAPWDKIASDLPMNFTNKRHYNGINIFLLWAAGYASPYWGTYKQWQEAGAQVKKGEKGTMIVFWKIVESKKKFDSDGNPETFPIPRYYKVFNSDQVEGWNAPTIETREHETNEIHAHCDAIINATGAKIRHGGNMAMYVPSLDVINLPEFEAFHTADDYYQTAFHELVHWTGHKSRLDRNIYNRFGDHAYALEELVAELGATIMGARVGIDISTRTDHAKYVKGWLKALKEEPSCLMHVASKSNKAVKFLLDFSAEQDKAEAA